MKGVVVKNSLVMQGTTVEKDAQLNYCILDKGVTITEGKSLNGDVEWPLIVGKNVKV
jgi:glucose-1-phosphate adenylyltransferase